MDQSTRVPMRTVLSHIAIPFLMGMIMALAYFGGFHAPSPREVPIAVVGPVEQVQPIADALHAELGNKATVGVIASADLARLDIQQLRLSGAYVPGDGSAEILTSSAASDITKEVVVRMLTPVADKTGVRATVTDIVPTSPHDPLGQNAFFYMVAVTVASYATAIGIGAAAATRRMWERIALAGGAAVLIASVSTVIAQYGNEMFDGHVGATWGLSVLYSAAVLFIGVGLHPILGRFSTVVYAATFVALNFTTCGGIVEPTMQPAFFGWLHHIWIGSGFIETMRRVTYFPLVETTSTLSILIDWFALGVLSLVAGFVVEQRRRPPGRHGRSELAGPVLEELEEDVAT